MPDDVYISYPPVEETFVTRLHQALINRGISAWYDKEDLEVADYWPTSIAEGIRGCKAFLLVLSPEAVESRRIRKEVFLADKHQKSIVPLLWRQTEIPVAFELHLAGIQPINFEETASEENFNELAEVLTRLIGGASMAEALSGIQRATEAIVPPLPKEEPGPSTGKRRLGGGRKSKKLNPVVIGGLVISNVVTTFDLDTDDQDFLNGELKWLFNAADHMIKIQNNEVELSQPVPVSIPPEAESSTEADNKLFPAFNSRRLVNGLIEHIRNIDKTLKNLDLLLEREVDLGDRAKQDLGLQTDIKTGRLRIVKIVKQVAQLMADAYGVKVTTPDQLLNLLQES